MRVFLTGGSGDLGTVLAPLLLARGDEPVLFDVRPPQGTTAVYRHGSILDRTALADAMANSDVVVHIAAWHGIHEVRGEKDVYDFWELNVTGTMEVLETAVRAGVPRMVHISSTSVASWPGVYGSSKRLAEELVRTYVARHRLNALVLRPRAFIPHWNRGTYADYIAWARWFWKGAVHIDDVAQAVLLSIDALAAARFQTPPLLPVDGAYEFTPHDLATWDVDGSGTTFRRVYADAVSLVRRYGLDPTLKPRPLDMGETVRLLGYRPRFSLRTLLDELATYGAAGPPSPVP